MTIQGRTRSAWARSTPFAQPAIAESPGMTAATAPSAPTFPVKRNSSTGPSRFTYIAVASASTAMQPKAARKRHRYGAA